MLPALGLAVLLAVSSQVFTLPKGLGAAIDGTARPPRRPGQEFRTGLPMVRP